MLTFWWVPVLILLVTGTAILGWWMLRPLGRELQLARVREAFLLQHKRLEAMFLAAASASGKPRGLRWVGCELGPQVELARERRTGQMTALAGVTIQFEAVEGGDMEGLPAVGNLRNASAVFFFQGGHWHPTGRALFDMNPDEALEHLREQYERLLPAGH